MQSDRSRLHTVPPVSAVFSRTLPACANLHIKLAHMMIRRDSITSVGVSFHRRRGQKHVIVASICDIRPSKTYRRIQTSCSWVRSPLPLCISPGCLCEHLVFYKWPRFFQIVVCTTIGSLKPCDIQLCSRRRIQLIKQVVKTKGLCSLSEFAK